MALRTVVTEGDDVLTKTSRPVVKFDDRLHDLLDDMAQTLHQYNGVGLAAPQVGILRRAVIIDLGDERGVMEFINPEIISAEGEQEVVEGCLSCPKQWGIVIRPKKVTAKAYDRNNNEFVMTGEGLLAQAMSHEFDHLDGILFKTRAERMLAPDEIETDGE